jgi:hypothetical protein
MLHAGKNYQFVIPANECEHTDPESHHRSGVNSCGDGGTSR